MNPFLQTLESEVLKESRITICHAVYDGWDRLFIPNNVAPLGKGDRY